MAGEMREKRPPGPDPKRVAIDGDWKDAVKKAIGVERPEGGWPDPDNRKKRAKRKSRNRTK